MIQGTDDNDTVCFKPDNGGKSTNNEGKLEGLKKKKKPQQIRFSFHCNPIFLK